MKQQKGFSLVELMIAITVGIVLMTGVVQMFVSSKTVFNTQQGLSRLQETGRLAVDYLARDIRQAGYVGCVMPSSWNLKNFLNNPNQFGNNFSPANALQVVESNLLPGGLVLDPAPVDGTQVLIVQSANDQSVAVNDFNSPDEVYVELTTAPGEDCPSGICLNDIVVVADCDKAIIFQATGVAEGAAPTSGDAAVVLTHEGGGDPGNARVTWGGGNARQESVEEGAELLTINNVVYYIAEDDNGTPGLYQRVQANPSFELLRGVENINYTLGVDTNADRLADAFVEPGDVGNWENAVAVRIDVLVQTPDDNATTEEQTYQFAGEEVVAEDRRIRQVFSTTVGVRSRLP